jgi:gluconate kinase
MGKRSNLSCCLLPYINESIATRPKSAKHGMPPQWPLHQAAMSASHLWVVTGPSGTGKSRVGNHIHDELGLAFVEGDEVSLCTNLPSLLPKPQAEPQQFLDGNDEAYLTANGVLGRHRYAEILTAVINTAIDTAREGSVVVACSALREADRHAWRDAVRLANSRYTSLDESPPLRPGNFEEPYLQAIQDPNFQGVQMPYQDIPGPYQGPNFQGVQRPYQDVPSPYQGPYLQNIQSPHQTPYPQTVASQGLPYLPTPPSDISNAATTSPTIHLHFIYLNISEEESWRAVRARRARGAHFMPESAVAAQFGILESPWEEEERDCRVEPSVKAELLMPIVRRYVRDVMQGRRDCTCMLCG